MTIKNRLLIQLALKENKTIRKIAKEIGLSPSTVSREIKKNIFLKRNTKILNLKEYSDEVLINTHDCELLLNSPYACNGCPKYINNTCSKNYLIYDYEKSENRYKEIKKLSNSKLKKIDSKIKLIKELNDRISKGQTIDHILYSLKTEGMEIISKSTFYNWAKKGNINYKSKKIKKKLKDNNDNKTIIKYVSRQKLIKDREYKDFLEYIRLKPNANIAEMDLICGKQGTNGYIFTLFIPRIQFLLAYKIEYKTPIEILKVFDDIETMIGFKNFKKPFEIILTDQGSEFLKRKILEKSKNCKLNRCKIFYCEAGTPTQKPNIENIHKLVRKVYPKGSSLENISQDDLNEVVSNINSLKKKSYQFKTPNEMFEFNFGIKLLKKLNIKTYIAKDVIIKNPTNNSINNYK